MLATKRWVAAMRRLVDRRLVPGAPEGALRTATINAGRKKAPRKRWRSAPVIPGD